MFLELFWEFFRNYFGIFLGIFLGILLEILLGILLDLNFWASGCPGVGKEKLDLMTGDKNRSLEARGLRTLALKKQAFNYSAFHFSINMGTHWMIKTFYFENLHKIKPFMYMYIVHVLYMSSRKLSMVLLFSNLKNTNCQYLKISLLNHLRPLELLITILWEKK